MFYTRRGAEVAKCWLCVGEGGSAITGSKSTLDQVEPWNNDLLHCCIACVSDPRASSNDSSRKTTIAQNVYSELQLIISNIINKEKVMKYSRF